MAIRTTQNHDTDLRCRLQIYVMKSVSWQSVRHRITTHICDAGFACFGLACIAILCTHAPLSQKTQLWHRIAMQATTFSIRTFQIRFQNLSVEGCTHTCDMTHSRMWHDSFIYVPWLMFICHRPHSWHRAAIKGIRAHEVQLEIVYVTEDSRVYV